MQTFWGVPERRPPKGSQGPCLGSTRSFQGPVAASAISQHDNKYSELDFEEGKNDVTAVPRRAQIRTWEPRDCVCSSLYFLPSLVSHVKAKNKSVGRLQSNQIYKHTCVSIAPCTGVVRGGGASELRAWNDQKGQTEAEPGIGTCLMTTSSILRHNSSLYSP